MTSVTKIRFSAAILAIFALIASMVVVPSAFLLPAAHAEDETQRIDMSITTVNHLTNGAPERLEYWSGEQINPVARFNASGAGVKIPNAVVTLRVPKSEYWDKPQFVDSAEANRSTQREDDQAWYVDYAFDNLRGGTATDVPFPFLFKNQVTPNGTTLNVTWTLKDGDGRVVKTVDKTFTAQSGMNYRAVKGLYPWGFPKDSNRHHTNVGGKNINTFGYSLENADSLTDISQLRPDGFVPVTYYIGFSYTAPEGAPRGTGEYRPKTVRFTENLPEGARLSQAAIAQGWAYTDGTQRVATRTMATKDVSANQHWCGYNSCMPLELEFTSGALKDNGQPKLHDNTVGVVMDPEGVNYDAGSATFPVIFKAMEKPKFPGRTHTMLMDKERYHNYDTYTFSDNGFYVGNERVDPASITGAKMGYNLTVWQGNNGSQVDGPKSGGITDTLTEVVDQNLAPGMYYSSVLLRSAGRYNGGATTDAEAKQRVLDAQPHVYGVAADGSETQLSTTPLIFGDWNKVRLVINDTERRYEKLIFRFANPLVMDNYHVQFVVEVHPTAAEKQKWAAKGYEATDDRGIYSNDMAVKSHLTGSPNEDTSPKAEIHTNNNTISIVGTRPTVLTEMWYNNNVPYVNCESKLPADTALTKDNCTRVKEYHLRVSPSGKWGALRGPLKNLREVILLPAGVNYVRTTNTAHNAHNGWDKTTLQPKVVPNFNNSGKTALIYEYGDVERNENLALRMDTIFELDTSLYAEPGPNKIEAYTVWDNNDTYRPHPNSEAVADKYDADGDGDTTEIVRLNSVTTNFIPPQELVTRKNISLDKNAWFLNAPAQDLGGNIYYRLELRNAGFAPVSGVSVMDVFPHLNDTKVSPNAQDEYLPRTWDKIGEDGAIEKVEHSAFTTPLSGPVEEVTAQKGDAITDAKARFDYFYSTVLQGATIDTVRDGEWLTAEQVTDWSTIRNFKAVLKEGERLAPGEVVRFITPHKIPYTEHTRALNIGDRAVNSVVASRNGVNYLEANEVTSEIVRYSVDGTVFKDFNKDGNAQANDDRLAGYTVKLIDNATGNVATHPDGTEVTTETDSNGHYAMTVYKRGDYRLQFTKKDADSFTIPGNGAEDVANHVTSCYADAAGYADAAAGKCAEDQARGVNLGITDTFTLSPTNRNETRNAGIRSVERDVIIHKVDQDGNNLTKGITFKLCLKDNAQSCETVQVNDEGLAIFKNKAFGTYLLTEENVPAGIEGLTEPKEIVVSETGFAYDEQGAALNQLEIVNNVIKATVTVKKVDADDTNKSLAGAVFTLTKKGDNATVYTSEPTGEDGIATFNDVLYGEYTLAEKTAPTNYNLSTEVKDVTVRKHRETIEVGAYTNSVFKGAVKGKKIDADTNAPIAGAVFALHKVGDNGNKVEPAIAEATSGPDGTFQLENIPFGTYKLVEKTPATGYLPTTVEKDITVATQGQLINLVDEPFTNTIKKGTITLKKVDFDNQATALEGVTFSLYAKNGDTVATDATATAQTQADGTATFTGVRYGTYVVRETATKDGYILEAGDRDVTIDTDGQRVDLGTITNKMIVGTVKVAKTNDDTPAKKLQGVKFGLYPVTNGAPAAAPAFEATTTAEGIAQFDRVTKGTYELREISTIAGHNLNTADKRTVTITTREQIEDLTANPVVNTRIRGDVLLKKVDAKNPANPLAGVEFGLYAKNTDGTIGAEPAYRQTTADDGTARFTRVLFGKYQLKEITPKLGYNPTTEPDGREVNIDAEGKLVDESANPFVNKIITSTVTLTKHDADTPTMLLGNVEFGLFPVVNGTTATVAAYTAKTNPAGVATFADVEYGSYKLRETKALINYVELAKEWDVTVVKEGATIEIGNVANTLKKGTVTLTKIDADTKKPIEGVTFVLKQGDEEKYTAKSDNNGLVEFTDVVYGEYVAVEKETLVNYNLNTAWTADVNIDADKKHVNLGTVENVLKKGSIVVTKVSEDDNNAPLAGAKFALKQGDNIIHEATTDDTGTITFEKVIYGEYTLVETEAPVGFVLNPQPVTVTISDEGQVVTPEAFTNKAIRGTVELTKLDATDKAPLAGVEFELVKGADVIATEASTDEGTVTFANVRFGEYIVREKAAPEGYVALTETFPVTIDTDKQVIALGNVENRRIVGDVQVKKVDAQTAEPLAGVEFGLYPAAQDADNAQSIDLTVEPAYKAVTNDEGIALFQGVEYGKWTLVERQPIEGYNPSTETAGREIVIENDGELVDAGDPFTNAKIRADITLTKVDKNGKGLAGATFTLRDKDGNTVAEKVSDANGLVTFERVAYGKYTVTETKAPAGYKLNATEVNVEVTVEGMTVDAGKIINERIPETVLAVTGADGRFGALAGTSLLLGAVLFGIRRRKR